MNDISIAKSLRVALAALALAGLTGCLGGRAGHLADREVYPILKQKETEALGRTLADDISPTTSALTQRVHEEAGTKWGIEGEEPSTTTSLVVNLADALALAVDNSYTWQDQKEALYLVALRLTAERHAFSPIFSEAISARALRQPGAGGAVERFGTATSDFAVTRLFATGARVTVGLSNDFLRFYSNPESQTASGLLSASVVQPLLRGAGSLVTLEPLRQSERDVIFAVRDYERFRKGFILSRINQYYRLLQGYDAIGNEWQAYQRLIVARERAEALRDAERLAPFQVDQARQDEIRARNRWIQARATYINLLNSFKVDLGLPTELDIQPDSTELQALEQRGMVDVPVALGDAEQLALTQRLDLMNVRDRFEDAQRRLKIANNGLLPDLDVSANASVRDGGNNQPLDFEGDTRRYGAGVDLDLPLDRKDERNAYRRAMIEVERARRASERLRNQILADVRGAWQDIQEARQSYEIQLASLELARKRVDNVRMLLELGREGISIRDQLDAESSLRDAQNGVTRVLVDYTIARLTFYDAIESLEIDDRGMWYEPTQSNS